MLYLLITLLYIYSSNSNSSQPDIDPTTVNNKLLAINIDHYPFEETYNEEDLNINWNPDTQKYTGFLPVTVRATGVPSYTSFYADVDGQLFQQPIQYNGKYKFVLKDDGPFATGLMPQFMRDQESNNYDIYINIPNNTPDISENIATLQITDGVLDSVLQLENGILNLPSSIPALNSATNFNTNGKNYATGVSIDLSNLTYYASMPQIDNGIYGNEIPINQNNVTITLLDDNEDKTDIEHTITYNNPSPTRRSIKAVNLLKDNKTREVTASDIVGYINVNIPPPNITDTIENNGYYKFNSNWNGLTEGTEQDHELDINVKASLPLLQNKTITIDSIENNSSYTVRPTTSAVNIMPVMISNNYNNGEVILTGSGTNGQSGQDYWNAFDGNTTSNYNGFYTRGQYSWIQISFSTPKKFNYFNYYCMPIQPTNYGQQTYVLGSNDNENFEYLYREENINPMVNNVSSYNYLTTTGEFLYYKFEFHTTTTQIYVTELQLMKTEEADGLNTVTIVNNTDSKIYKGYNDNNKYSITQTGDGTITIPTNYQALGEIKYNVNVPTTTVDNADVDSQNNNVISTNGTYTIPSGKTGWNSFEVDVPQTTVNNYNGYNANNPLVISSTTGTITIPEGFSGLGEIHFSVIEPKKRAVKYGLTYSNYKGLISGLPNAGGNYWIHRYYGEGNTTQVFINPTENKVISLASSGNAWELYVPATYKHVELSTGDNSTTDYYLCLYDENDEELYRLRNQTGNGGSYTQYTNTVPSDVEIIA